MIIWLDELIFYLFIWSIECTNTVHDKPLNRNVKITHTKGEKKKQSDWRGKHWVVVGPLTGVNVTNTSIINSSTGTSQVRIQKNNNNTKKRGEKWPSDWRGKHWAVVGPLTDVNVTNTFHTNSSTGMSQIHRRKIGNQIEEESIEQLWDLSLMLMSPILSIINSSTGMSQIQIQIPQKKEEEEEEEREKGKSDWRGMHEQLSFGTPHWC